LNGTIAYLTRKYGGNVHRGRFVTVTASSVQANPKRSTHDVVDLDLDTCFQAEPVPNQWLRWDFRKRRLFLSDYTVRSHELKNWRLEVSIDGEEWIQVDHQGNNQQFQRPPALWIGSLGSFSIAHPVECRFIRLVQEGLNHNNNLVLSLNAVEFFGTLFE
jgi:hypothetical protein